jgi:hypothetical protein
MKKNIYKFFYKPKKSKNYLVAAAIGAEAMNDFKKYSLNLWKKYCKINDIGILVFQDYIVKKSDSEWKSATWQKHLFGKYIIDNIKDIENICLLDLDILVNPHAPNIFDYLEKNKISVISHLKNLPYSNSENLIRRKIAFNRHHYYTKRYPLDSSMTMSNKQVFNYHGFKDPGDYFCFGVFMYNLKNHAEFIYSTYYNYKPKVKSLTAGNEPFINHEVLTKRKVKWLDYKFQAYWIFEMVEKYPFLYEFKNKKNVLIKKCIEASLQENYFLHFTGSWYDGDHWKMKGIFQSAKTNNIFKKFLKFKKYKLKNKAHKNRIMPKGKSVIKKI